MVKFKKATINSCHKLLNSYKTILRYVTREDGKSLNKTNNREGGKLVPFLN